MDKLAVYDLLVELLRDQCQKMRDSTKDAVERALEGEGRMKSRYDTKRIEGSYLADGLSKRSEELLLELGRAVEFRRHVAHQSSVIQGGSLFYGRTGAKEEAYFILPFAAGEQVEIGSRTLHVLSPSGPLARGLLGRKAGDKVQVMLPPDPNDANARAEHKVRQLEILEVL